MQNRIVFMGSPEFAIPGLQLLAEHYQVVGVVTQPDRPAGRGRKLTPPPVKVLAQHLGVPVIQPNRLKEPWAFEQLQAWQPEVIVVAAFGQILRANVLDLPSFGCINVHASLLPRWRGAAPIQAAILNGDSETGITIMKLDPGMDTGPILSQRKLPIGPTETAGILSDRLAIMGAELLLDTLPPYLKGEIQPMPQEDTLATYAPRLEKSDGKLDFNKSARELARQVRAFNPWPGCFTTWQGQILKIHQAHEIPDFEILPGQPAEYQNYPGVGTQDGLLVLDKVQPAGKHSMSGEVFLRGARTWLSDPLG